MAKGSDNKFPKVIITEGSAPSNADSGDQKLYIDSADHKLKRKDSSGTVTTIESAAGSDTSAVHTNVANEISGITEKTSLTGNDLFIIEDSAAAGVKKKVKQSNLGGGGASTADPFIIGQGTAADLSAKVQISGLTGSADINGAAGAGTSEEFDGADPLTWSANPTAFDCNSTAKSHYYFSDNSNTAKYGYVAWSPAGAFDARMKLGVGSHLNVAAGVAFWIGDSANSNGVALSIEFATTNPNQYGLNAYTVATGSFTKRGNTHYFGGSLAYLRIQRDGSNNFTFQWSNDGLIWNTIAVQNFSLTVARKGFRINTADADTTHYLYGICDWIRTDV